VQTVICSPLDADELAAVIGKQERAARNRGLDRECPGKRVAHTYSVPLCASDEVWDRVT